MIKTDDILEAAKLSAAHYRNEARQHQAKGRPEMALQAAVRAVAFDALIAGNGDAAEMLAGRLNAAMSKAN